MNQLRRLLSLVVMVIVLGSLAPSIAFAQDPDNGKLLWEEQVFQCSKCHGPAGEGLYAGPRAGDGKTLEQWITQVRTPRRNMPHFSEEQVSDEQLADMHAYMESLPPVTDFQPMQVDLPADAPAGQMLIVEKRCVACHGPTGPVNRFVDRGEIPTAEAVIKQLRTPFNKMPSFSVDQVSDEEATLIAEFMATEASGQMAPSTLPQSGGDSPTTLPFTLLFIGGGLVLVGFVARRLMVRA